MRWSRFLLLFVAASLLHAGGEGDARLTSPRVVEVTPGKIVTASILVSNTSDADAVYEESFGLPSGWLRISPPSMPIPLAPGRRELRLVAFVVPAASPSGSFDIDYTLSDAPTRAPVATARLTVVVLPVGKLELVREDQTETVIAGEACAPRLRIINRGNSRLKVAISAQASPARPVRLESAEVWIEPAASHVFRAHFETDVEQREPLTQVVRFTVASTGADGAKITAARAVAVNIIPRVSGDLDPYVRLPARLRLTAVAENGRAGAQSEFSGDGFVDEERKQRLDFLFRGPSLERQSMFGLRDEYRVSYHGPELDLHVGDRNYSLSPLTQRFNYGRGAAVDFHPGPTSAGAFFMETVGRTREFQTAGAYVTHQYTPAFSVQASALHKSEPGLASLPESVGPVDLVSLRPRFDFGERLDLDLEYGASSAGSGPESQAHRAEARGRLFEDVTYSLERIKAGNEFFGYYHATESTQAAVTFPIHGPLRGKASFNQAARDAYANSYADRASPLAVYASRQTSYRPGLLFRVSDRTDLSLEYQHIERHADGRTTSRDSLEKSARLGVGHSRDKFGVQSFAEFGVIGKNVSGEGDENETVARLSTFVSYRPTTGQSYSVHGSVRSSSSNVDPTERSQTLGVSAHWTLGPRVDVDLDYTRNQYDSRTARVQDTASGAISYTMPNRHVASLRTRWQNDLGSSEALTSVSVSYMIPFGLPVSKKKGGGVLRGQIFERVGGVSQPLSRVIVTANGITAVTDRQGRFVFPSLRPGTYQVNVEQSSLGPGRVTLDPVPLAVEVEKDEARELSVGVVDAASVRGKIVLFGDARGGLGPGDRGAGAEKEYKALGGFSAGLVELTNGREVLRQLTDSDGAVSFDNLRPGKWTLRVHKNNLPPHHLIETPETDLEIGPGQTREVFVRVLPVRRSIRFIDGGTISPVTSR
jgi:hypothetical protein